MDAADWRRPGAGDRGRIFRPANGTAGQYSLSGTANVSFRSRRDGGFVARLVLPVRPVSARSSTVKSGHGCIDRDCACLHGPAGIGVSADVPDPEPGPAFLSVQLERGDCTAGWMAPDDRQPDWQMAIGGSAGARQPGAS